MITRILVPPELTSLASRGGLKPYTCLATRIRATTPSDRLGQFFDVCASIQRQQARMHLVITRGFNGD